MKLNESSSPLAFKPLTKGLGFESHVFPSSKKTQVVTPLPSLPNPRQLILPDLDSEPQETPEKKDPGFSLEEESPPFLLPGIWARMTAYFVDTLASLTGFSLLLGSILFMRSVPISILGSMGIWCLLSCFFAVFHSAVLAIQESLFKTSLGKKLFQIEVQGTPLRLILRSLLFPLNFFLLGLGLVTILWDPENRGWHDHLTHAKVVML